MSEIKYIFFNNTINKYNEKVLRDAKKARRNYYRLLLLRNNIDVVQ